MSSHNLIVFIDSLPHRYAERMPFFAKHYKEVKKVLPGFGYSINLKAEIFGGYVPDKAGFLNEWSYDKNSCLRKYKLLFTLLDFFRRFYYIDRIIHKILSKIFGYNILNIPLRYLSYFSKNGTEAYRDEFHLTTIFSQMQNHKKVCYYHYSYGPERDNSIFRDTVKATSSYNNIFVAFGDLDGVAHNCGVGTEKYDSKIDELDKYLNSMYEHFRNTNPKGTFIVFSDHGMANVKESVNFDMENLFGRASEKTYLYFVDATMLRVWCFSEDKRQEIETYLSTYNIGKILNNEQRRQDGITSASFGDIIFHLDEGFVFCPGFMGRKMPMAMHGYNGDFENQIGLCLILNDENIQLCSQPTVRTIELYDLLKKQIKAN